jgi:hypothetical protein
MGFHSVTILHEDPPTAAGMRVHARFCEGVHCCELEGEVRLYPILSVSCAARVILCRPCWEHENRYRHQRGKELRCPEHWPTRDWNAAQRYQPLCLSAAAAAATSEKVPQSSAARRNPEAWAA